MKATRRDESQSVPSPENPFKTRDSELPSFEALHPYFPVAKLGANPKRSLPPKQVWTKMRVVVEDIEKANKAGTKMVAKVKAEPKSTLSKELVEFNGKLQQTLAPSVELEASGNSLLMG